MLQTRMSRLWTAKVLSNRALCWGQDLTAVAGLNDLVASHPENILKNGAKAAIASIV